MRNVDNKRRNKEVSNHGCLISPYIVELVMMECKNWGLHEELLSPYVCKGMGWVIVSGKQLFGSFSITPPFHPKIKSHPLSTISFII
jgi:hypothetical protein